MMGYDRIDIYRTDSPILVAPWNLFILVSHPVVCREMGVPRPAIFQDALIGCTLLLLRDIPGLRHFIKYAVYSYCGTCACMYR